MLAVNKRFERALPQTLDEARSALRVLIQQYDFEEFSYVGGQAFNARTGGHAIWTKPPTVLVTVPQEWVQLYHQEDFGAVDPVISAALERRLPLVWDVKTLTPPAHRQSNRFIEGAHDYGVYQGISIPVYGPLGDFAFFSFMSRASQRDFTRIVERHKNDLHVASLYYHQIITDIVSKDREPVRLTVREREVLVWAAAGKTTEETGLILGLANKTVQFHLYNAMRKLDVYTKPQAVAQAILLGLLRL